MGINRLSATNQVGNGTNISPWLRAPGYLLTLGETLVAGRRGACWQGRRQTAAYPSPHCSSWGDKGAMVPPGLQRQNTTNTHKPEPTKTNTDTPSSDKILCTSSRDKRQTGKLPSGTATAVPLLYSGRRGLTRHLHTSGFPWPQELTWVPKPQTKGLHQLGPQGLPPANSRQRPACSLPTAEGNFNGTLAWHAGLAHGPGQTRRQHRTHRHSHIHTLSSPHRSTAPPPPL